MTTEKKQFGALRDKIGESSLTRLFETGGPCVLAFISKMTQLPAGVPPVFPPIFGTGFVVAADGLVVTNRHVQRKLQGGTAKTTTAGAHH